VLTAKALIGMTFLINLACQGQLLVGFKPGFLARCACNVEAQSGPGKQSSSREITGFVGGLVKGEASAGVVDLLPSLLLADFSYSNSQCHFKIIFQIRDGSYGLLRRPIRYNTPLIRNRRIIQKRIDAILGGTLGLHQPPSNHHELSPQPPEHYNASW
jgi:hypothetical protein